MKNIFSLICNWSLRKLDSIRRFSNFWREKFYWKGVVFKDSAFRRLQSDRRYLRITSIFNNFQIYTIVLSEAIVAKLQRKKVIVVFLLVRAHYGWVKEALQNVSNQERVKIQIFSLENLSSTVKGHFFNEKHCANKVSASDSFIVGGFVSYSS